MWRTAQKNKLFFRISSVNVTKAKKTADVLTLNKETLNGKLHFLYSGEQTKWL